MLDPHDPLTDLDQLRSRYDVLRLLGQDGDAPVYAARGPVTGEHFVVCVLPERRVSSARRGALHPWQAQTIAPLDHEGIMTIHSVHHLQGGAIAVSVERRRGETLAERIERLGPLPGPEARAIVLEMAEALAYLHGRGVALRGLRPASVFLDRDAGRARLIPFAIEGPGGRANVDLALRTAPELLRRDGSLDDRRVGPRSDLFALGVLAQTLWRAAGDEEDSRFEDALRRCRSERPAARPRDGRELLELLRAVSGDDPSGSPRWGPAGRVSAAWERVGRAVAGVPARIPPVRGRLLSAGARAGAALGFLGLVSAGALWIAAGRSPDPEAPPPISLTEEPAGDSRSEPSGRRVAIVPAEAEEIASRPAAAPPPAAPMRRSAPAPGLDRPGRDPAPAYVLLGEPIDR